MGRLHIVPLVPEAITILEQMRGLFGGKPDEPIFPGLKGPMSDATMSKVLRVHGGGKYTVHGFRSSFRDWRLLSTRCGHLAGVTRASA